MPTPTVSILLRVSPEFHEQCHKAAHERQLSLSAWVREAMSDHLQAAKPATKPVRVAPPRRGPSPDDDEY